MLRAWLYQLQGSRGRIEARHWDTALDGTDDLHLHTATSHACVKGQPIVQRATLLGQYLCVLNLDLLLAPRGNGENRCLKELTVYVFEQAGVLHSTDNALIDRARLFAGEHLSLHARAIHPQRKVGGRRSLGNREVEDRLRRPRTRVMKHLRDLGYRRMISDLRLYPVATKLKGCFGWLSREHDPLRGSGRGQHEARHKQYKENASNHGTSPA